MFRISPQVLTAYALTLILQISVALVSNAISLFKDGCVWDMELADRGQLVSQICVIDSDY